MNAFLSACTDVADALRTERQLVVFGHRDTDGICAALILKLGMPGADVEVRIIRHGMRMEDMARMAGGRTPVFVDYGSTEIPVISRTFSSFYVLDHHPSPHTHPRLLNPWDFGIDGTRELSGAGVAYLVMRAYDASNTRLAPLAIVGAMGDKQYLSRFRGPNALLVEDARKRGCLEGEPDEHLVVGCLPFAEGRMSALSAAKLIDACASVNRPEVAVRMLEGDRAAALEAEEIHADYTARYDRQLAAIRAARAEVVAQSKEHLATFVYLESLEPGFSGVLAEDLLEEFPEKPLVVISGAPYGLKASARARAEHLEAGMHLGTAMAYAASHSNGKGGGHDVAAGATLIPEALDEFKARLTYLLFSQIPARLKVALTIDMVSPEAAKSLAEAVSIDNEPYHGTRARTVHGTQRVYVLVSSDDLGTFRNTVDDLLVCLSSCSGVVSLSSNKV